MIKIEIETETIIKVLTLIFAMIGVVACAILGFAYITNDHQENNPVGTATTITPVPTLAMTPTPTPTPSPSYPSVITYTVLSTTMSSGHYQVTTTTGQILYCVDYADWISHDPRDTFTASVTGMDGTAYLISSPTLIYQHYDYTQYYDTYGVRYYEYNDQYWQCDRYSCDPVTWKQARGERIIYAKPPQFESDYSQYGGANPHITYGSGNPWQGE
jgi:hypothetical protein